MRTLLLLFSALWCSLPLQAQKLKQFEKNRIIVGPRANTTYPVMYLPKTSTVAQRTNTYNPGGAVLSYEEKQVPNWSAAAALNPAVLHANGLPGTAVNEELTANINYEEGRMNLYFFQINGNVAYNTFVNSHYFFINLPDRVNLAINYSCIQMGVYTVPLKIYLDSRNEKNVNNATTEVNTGFIIGLKWGKNKFVKLPHEKEVRNYVTASSVNLLVGVSRLEIDDKTTVTGTTVFDGNVPAANLAVAYGFHYKSFSLLLPIGFDIPMSSEAKNWAFKGKPWLGIGFGFDLF